MNAPLQVTQSNQTRPMIRKPAAPWRFNFASIRLVFELRPQTCAEFNKKVNVTIKELFFKISSCCMSFSRRYADPVRSRLVMGVVIYQMRVQTISSGPAGDFYVHCENWGFKAYAHMCIYVRFCFFSSVALVSIYIISIIYLCRVIVIQWLPARSERPKVAILAIT